ncbi:MAG: DUF305 domain-containing protein [Aquabacterium sp.]
MSFHPNALPRLVLLCGALAVSCATHVGIAQAASNDPNPQTSTPTPATVEQAMKDGMQAMQAIPISGDVDKDFAALMKAHHEQAVKMAEVEVRDGRSPELKAMARKMIRDQKREVDMLGKWLQEHR